MVSVLPQTLREENPYVTILACWGEEEADSELSNEEEDGEVISASLKANDAIEGPSSPTTITNKYVHSTQYTVPTVSATTAVL